MKKLIVTLALVAGFTSQAHAWGEREQGILTGIAAAVIIANIANQHPGPIVNQQPPVVIQQQPVIIQQPPVVVYQPRQICENFAIYDNWGRYAGYRTFCRNIY